MELFGFSRLPLAANPGPYAGIARITAGPGLVLGVRILQNFQALTGNVDPRTFYRNP